MPKTIQKEKVTVTIRPGTMSPVQRIAERKFWQRLIASVREELDKEGKQGG